MLSIEFKQGNENLKFLCQYELSDLVRVALPENLNALATSVKNLRKRDFSDPVPKGMIGPDSDLTKETEKLVRVYNQMKESLVKFLASWSRHKIGACKHVIMLIDTVGDLLMSFVCAFGNLHNEDVIRTIVGTHIQPLMDPLYLIASWMNIFHTFLFNSSASKPLISKIGGDCVYNKNVDGKTDIISLLYTPEKLLPKDTRPCSTCLKIFFPAGMLTSFGCHAYCNGFWELEALVKERLSPVESEESENLFENDEEEDVVAKPKRKNYFLGEEKTSKQQDEDEDEDEEEPYVPAKIVKRDTTIFRGQRDALVPKRTTRCRSIAFKTEDTIVSETKERIEQLSCRVDVIEKFHEFMSVFYMDLKDEQSTECQKEASKFVMDRMLHHVKAEEREARSEIIYLKNKIN